MQDQYRKNMRDGTKRAEKYVADDRKDTKRHHGIHAKRCKNSGRSYPPNQIDPICRLHAVRSLTGR
jgi:hypothetical protein